VTLPAGPGQVYLIDTSAHARSQHELIRNVIAGLIADRAAATCVTVDLEAGYSGRDLRDVRIIAQRRKETRGPPGPVPLCRRVPPPAQLLRPLLPS
jgi:hypothetical protein